MAKAWTALKIIGGITGGNPELLGMSEGETITRSKFTWCPPGSQGTPHMVELDGYRKVIECARQVIANYTPIIRIDRGWPRVPLGDVCKIDGSLVDSELLEYAALPYVSAENMESSNGRLMEIRAAAEDEMTSGKYLFGSGRFYTRNSTPIYRSKLGLFPRFMQRRDVSNKNEF